MENTNDKRLRRTRHALKSVAVEGRKRLSVYRSNTGIYAQNIDDETGLTLASASTVDKKIRKDLKSAKTIDAAAQVGTELAKRAKAAGVVDVYFDRGGNRYHGRIKALADAARAGGLNF